MEKYIFSYFNKDELRTYLDSLTFDELCSCVNAIDHSLTELDRIVSELIYYIDIDIRIRILDDLYNRNINDYRMYLMNLVKQINNYFEDNIYKYFNEHILEPTCYNNTKEIQYKHYIRVPLIDKETITDYILAVYSSALKCDVKELKYWHFFNTPCRPYSYPVIKLLDKEMNKIVMEIEEQLTEDNIDYEKYLSEISEKIKLVLEINTELIIDTKEIFKSNLSLENYQILEKYNCLEKIGLCKYPSIWPVDFADAFGFFKDSKILKIIDGDKEYKINEGNPEKLFIVRICFNSTIKDSYEFFLEMRRKYQCDGDNIIIEYEGEDKLLVIFAK